MKTTMRDIHRAQIEQIAMALYSEEPLKGENGQDHKWWDIYISDRENWRKLARNLLAEAD